MFERLRHAIFSLDGPLPPDAKRAAVYDKLRVTSAQEKSIGKLVGQARVASYQQRIQEIGSAMGATPPDDLPKQLVSRMQRHGMQAAHGIAQTHNRELQHFTSALPDELDQGDMMARANAWQFQRTKYKGRQIAYNEGSTGRNQADRDLWAHNEWMGEVTVEVVPFDAAEEQCADLVANNPYKVDEVDFQLPLHVGCLHGLAYLRDLADIASEQGSVWLGRNVAVDEGEE